MPHPDAGFQEANLLTHRQEPRQLQFHRIFALHRTLWLQMR